MLLFKRISIQTLRFGFQILNVGCGNAAERPPTPYSQPAFDGMEGLYTEERSESPVFSDIATDLANLTISPRKRVSSDEIQPEQNLLLTRRSTSDDRNRYSAKRSKNT